MNSLLKKLAWVDVSTQNVLIVVKLVLVATESLTKYQERDTQAN